MTAEQTLTAIRRILFAALVIGMAGMETELLLLGHVEDAWQLLPVVLLGLGLLIAVWHGVGPSRRSVMAIQLLMLVFIVVGPLGTMMHYQGNTEFELEMYPSLSGFELIKETVTGATPVLAPGTMMLLGLIGLAQTYQLRTQNAERRTQNADGRTPNEKY